MRNFMLNGYNLQGPYNANYPPYSTPGTCNPFVQSNPYLLNAEPDSFVRREKPEKKESNKDVLLIAGGLAAFTLGIITHKGISKLFGAGAKKVESKISKQVIHEGEGLANGVHGAASTLVAPKIPEVKVVNPTTTSAGSKTSVSNEPLKNSTNETKTSFLDRAKNILSNLKNRFSRKGTPEIKIEKPIEPQIAPALYDASGHPVTSKSTSALYDTSGHPVNSKNAPALYDPAGHPVTSKSAPALYDPAGHPVTSESAPTLYDPAGHPVTSKSAPTLYDPDGHPATSKSAPTLYNPIGTPVASGIIKEEKTSVFGRVRSKWNNFRNIFTRKGRTEVKIETPIQTPIISKNTEVKADTTTQIPVVPEKSELEFKTSASTPTEPANTEAPIKVANSKQSSTLYDAYNHPISSDTNGPILYEATGKKIGEQTPSVTLYDASNHLVTPVETKPILLYEGSGKIVGEKVITNNENLYDAYGHPISSDTTNGSILYETSDKIIPEVERVAQRPLINANIEDKFTLIENELAEIENVFAKLTGTTIQE